MDLPFLLQNIDWNTYKKGNKDNLNLVIKSLVANTIARPSLLTNQDDFISYLMFYYLLDGECLVRKIRTANKYDLMIYKKNMYSYKFLDIAGTVELKVNGESVLDVDNYYIFRNTNIYSHIAGADKKGRSIRIRIETKNCTRQVLQKHKIKKEDPLE